MKFSIFDNDETLGNDLSGESGFHCIWGNLYGPGVLPEYPNRSACIATKPAPPLNPCNPGFKMFEFPGGGLGCGYTGGGIPYGCRPGETEVKFPPRNGQPLSVCIPAGSNDYTFFSSAAYAWEMNGGCNPNPQLVYGGGDHPTLGPVKPCPPGNYTPPAINPAPIGNKPDPVNDATVPPLGPVSNAPQVGGKTTAAASKTPEAIAASDAGDIFGVSPLVLIAAAAAGLWFFSSAK